MSEEEVEAEVCPCCSLVCAALNICCFLCSRKACPCCFPKPPASKPEFSVLCLGVKGAGKTSLLCQLAGEPLEEDPDPTMGFSIKPCSVPSASLQVKEVGGASKLRPYWGMYYSNMDALIFVVDSGVDRNGLLEATFWLHSCLSNPDTAGLPLLVLCNKQDLQEARSAQTVSEEMNLSQLCDGRQYRVEGSSRGDMEGLRRAIDSLAKLVIAYKKKGIDEMVLE